jgi:hypothetical protein
MMMSKWSLRFQKMSASDNHLLQILNAHGQQFLDSFSLPAASAPKKRKHAGGPSRPAKIQKLQPAESELEEEESGEENGQSM